MKVMMNILSEKQNKNTYLFTGNFFWFDTFHYTNSINDQFNTRWWTLQCTNLHKIHSRQVSIILFIFYLINSFKTAKGDLVLSGTIDLTSISEVSRPLQRLVI